MKRIKIAQIGIGNAHSLSNFMSLVEQPELFDVKGYCLCDGDEDKYIRDNKTYDIVPRLLLEEILDDSDLDAVSIEPEEMYGTRYALMAAERRLHIFLDKPGGVAQTDFEELARIVKENNLVLHMGYMYRHNPAYLEALEIIESGKLGIIYSVEAHMDGLNTVDLRRWLNNLPAGQMYFLGCHLVDIILRIKGVPDEILPLSTSTGLEGVQSVDNGMAVFRYPSGISFIKTCAREPGGFMRRQVVICGSKGTVEINPIERYISPCIGRRNHMSRMRVTYENDPKGWVASGEFREYGPYNRYDGMTAAFAREIHGEEKNPYSVDYEVLLHKLLLKACGMADMD